MIILTFLIKKRFVVVFIRFLRLVITIYISTILLVLFIVDLYLTVFPKNTGSFVNVFNK